MPGKESVPGLRETNSTADHYQFYSITAEEKKIQTEKEEQILLELFAQGDSNAFWSLWMRYQDSLYSCCLRWMEGNREDAEDVLSSACIKAWNKLPDYSGKITNLKGWLARLTHNLCMDIHRKRERQSELIQHIEYISEVDKEAVAYVQESSEETILHREMCKHIRYAINTLPIRLRVPVILHFYHDMPYQDIAVRLALSIENIRKRIQQARAILKQQLNEYFSVGNVPAWAKQGADEPIMDNLESFVDEAFMHRWREEEIKPQIGVIYPVQVTLPSGVEMQFYIALGHKPMRQHQKVETLRKYVQQYPSGWKKRLELANLLYTMGNWEEAIEEYRQALDKQPRLIDVYLQLGNLLHLMEREEEAIAVYERSLPFACKAATQRHVCGLIEICRRRHEPAVRAFEEATSLEPGNVVHWHALGLTHLRAEHPVECIRAFNEALKINPDDIVALTYSHDPLCVMGRFKEAQRRVARALKIKPDNVLALK